MRSRQSQRIGGHARGYEDSAIIVRYTTVAVSWSASAFTVHELGRSELSPSSTARHFSDNIEQSSSWLESVCRRRYLPNVVKCTVFWCGFEEKHQAITSRMTRQSPSI